jgi:hypothetical protein
VMTIPGATTMVAAPRKTGFSLRAQLAKAHSLLNTFRHKWIMP